MQALLILFCAKRFLATMIMTFLPLKFHRLVAMFVFLAVHSSQPYRHFHPAIVPTVGPAGCASFIDCRNIFSAEQPQYFCEHCARGVGKIILLIKVRYEMVFPPAFYSAYRAHGRILCFDLGYSCKHKMLSSPRFVFGVTRSILIWRQQYLRLLATGPLRIVQPNRKPHRIGPC